MPDSPEAEVLRADELRFDAMRNGNSARLETRSPTT